MPGMPDRRMVFITMAGTAVLASLVLMVWRDKGIVTGKTGRPEQRRMAGAGECDIVSASQAERRF